MTPHGSGETEAGTRIVAMLNQKGGVGKTTTAVNLGAALAADGQRVCLIDLDPQAHLTLHLGIDAGIVRRTVYDLLIDDDCTVDDAIIVGARENLDALLAEVDLAGAETELASRRDRQAILARKLAAVADRYDVVIIDCPPSLGLLTLNALTMATELIVPMQAHFLALQGVGRLLETVGLVCRSVNPSLRVAGIVLCMHEANTTLAREIVADLEAFFEAARGQESPWQHCEVLRPPIRRNIKLAEAPSFGQTIFDYAPWCPGALDYRRLARNLVAAWEDDGVPGDTEGAISPAPPAPPAPPSAPEPESPPTADVGVVAAANEANGETTRKTTGKTTGKTAGAAGDETAASLAREAAAQSVEPKMPDARRPNGAQTAAPSGATGSAATPEVTVPAATGETGDERADV